MVKAFFAALAIAPLIALSACDAPEDDDAPLPDADIAAEERPFPGDAEGVGDEGISEADAVIIQEQSGPVVAPPGGAN